MRQQEEERRGGGTVGTRTKKRWGNLLFYNGCQDVKATALAQNTFQQQLLLMIMMDFQVL
jgi:hypothetical protein